MHGCVQKKRNYLNRTGTNPMKVLRQMMRFYGTLERPHKKTRLKRPQFPFGKCRVEWHGIIRKCYVILKLEAWITGIVVPSGGTLGKKSMATVGWVWVENLREENPELHGIIVPKWPQIKKMTIVKIPPSYHKLFHQNGPWVLHQIREQLLFYPLGIMMLSSSI